jgi:hypothetical protein
MPVKIALHLYVSSPTLLIAPSTRHRSFETKLYMFVIKKNPYFSLLFYVLFLVIESEKKNIFITMNYHKQIVFN